MYKNCSFVPLSSYESLPKTTCVYCISGQYISENLSKTVYIGSSNDLKYRACTHYRDLENNTHHNPFLQNAYKKHKGVWFIGILEETSEEKQFEKEQHYLDILQPFCNDNGGFNINKYASKPPSAKGRAAHSKGKKLGPRPLKTRLKISSTLKGRELSFEHRLKISLVNKGKKLSPETKLKISLTGKGKKRSLETKLKMSLAHKKRSPESVKKALETRRKNGSDKKSFETRLKISNTLKGRKLKLESIQKRTETRKRNKLLKETKIF
jgi:group I intron endonuclease